MKLEKLLFQHGAAAAEETVKHDFAVFTGLSSCIIESVEVAPVLAEQEAVGSV